MIMEGHISHNLSTNSSKLKLWASRSDSGIIYLCYCVPPYIEGLRLLLTYITDKFRMGRPQFIAVMLVILLGITALGELAKGTSLEDPAEETLQTGFDSEEEKEMDLDTQDWDDEFEGTPTLRVLNDDNFEHDTQAATGQTTGIWLVLFWSHHSVPSRNAEATLLQVYTQMRHSHLLIAAVNVSSNPRTVQRFDIQKVPVLILFRERRMYTYKGHWAVMNIIKFVKGGYESVTAETVPKEITYSDQLLETLSLYYQAIITYLANRPGILAGVGSTLAMCGYLRTKRWLMRRQLNNAAKGRPRKRVD
ncbi:hypothetical protein R1flu_026015 [Riccia fluitans]|uniref:Thioredoxin domain-containing protein n=1 Tax=Riccia fluitans TaxID=41844 RepID=A0ABD1XES7_9MARC